MSVSRKPTLGWRTARARAAGLPIDHVMICKRFTCKLTHGIAYNE